MVDSSVEIARTRTRPARTTSRRGKYIQSRRALKVGLAFISPWILGFLAFTVIPLATSLYYSFTDYNGLSVSNWVGFRNYEQIFTKDPYIRVALYNTLYLAVFGVVLGGVLAFVIALLLNQKVRGIGIYRTLFYLPTMLPIVVSAFVFTLVLDPSTGVLNKVLSWFGVTGPGWLFSTTWSKPALIILGLWGVGNSVIIYLAGLQDIPKHLIEAATVDGAGWWARLRNVTMPLLSPIIFFNLLLAIIYAFQNFISVFYLTSNGGGSTAGGPANSTMTWGLLIYEDAFVNSQIGYASAMSWLMLIFVLIITALMFGMSKRWVYYEGAGPR